MKVLRNRNPIRAAVILVLGIAVVGCSVLSPQEDRTRYFVLRPVASSGSTVPAGIAGADHTVTIGLGPVSVPRYLDRPEVVTRLTDTEFSASETDRWGEPLDTGVSQVLAQDLSSELPGLEVEPFPWSKKTEISYRVSVKFFGWKKQRMEGPTCRRYGRYEGDPTINWSGAAPQRLAALRVRIKGPLRQH
jgi:uncharacterized lipoprotein YmbA